MKRQWGQHAAGDPARVDDNEDFEFFTLKMLFDISFFVIILTIGLNVIFGIIVDTFRQLRDAKEPSCNYVTRGYVRRDRASNIAILAPQT